jgi:hypothetical protein
MEREKCFGEANQSESTRVAVNNRLVGFKKTRRLMLRLE